MVFGLQSLARMSTVTAGEASVFAPISAEISATIRSAMTTTSRPSKGMRCGSSPSSVTEAVVGGDNETPFTPERPERRAVPCCACSRGVRPIEDQRP